MPAVTLSHSRKGYCGPVPTTVECERLLRVHPQRGIQVMEVDLDFVREAYQLRLMIELEGARRLLEEPG
mgnify:CR=1 FL=1